MTLEQYSTLIDYFGVIVDSWAEKKNPKSVNNHAAKRGYIIEEKCCNEVAVWYVKSKNFNPNTTFYKTFQEVTEKDRFELFIDQLLHYASTYGTNYEGEVYCPNGDPINIPYQEYKVIKAITAREMHDKCLELLGTNVALDSVFVDAVCQLLSENYKNLKFPIDLDSIANKEALIILMDRVGLVPNNAESILRYIAYKCTGKAMVVQSHRELYKMKRFFQLKSTQDELVKILGNLNECQMRNLATVFFRYKNFILTWKGARALKPIVNKIRRMADQYHKPMRIGFWEGLTNLSAEEVAERIDTELEKLNNPFKIIKLLEMIKLRKLQNINGSKRIFHNRIGGIFVDHNKHADYPIFLDTVAEALLTKLVLMLSEDRKNKFLHGYATIAFPENLELALPSSAKTFVGNVPFGSRYKMMGNDNYFGIYWRGEDGTQDFDLSLVSDSGNKIGWNSDYYDGCDIVFSGDMTSANPEATEMFYCSGMCPNGTIYVNRYNGEHGSKYTLFFGQSRCEGFKKNYMVDPNTIKCRVQLISDNAQQIVGRIQDGYAYIMNFDNGNRRVSSERDAINDSIRDKCKAHIDLKSVMLAAGYTEWDPESETVPNIDLRELNIQSILSLLDIKE